MVSFAVLMLCPGVLGSGLESSRGTQKPSRKQEDEDVCVCHWPAVSLCALCYCHCYSEKKKKRKKREVCFSQG